MPDGNILFVLTDQWPSWALSFLGADIPTPNIDRLAAQGTIFTNAFTTCPLCTPARGALLTSRLPHQTGVYDNFNVGHSQQTSLSMEETTWIDEAVHCGYDVGYFGKWHLGLNDPEKRGAHGYDPHRPLNPGKKKQPYSYQRMHEYYTNQEQQRLVRGRAPFWGELSASKETLSPFPVIANGVAVLENWAAGNREKPFFLTLSSAPPHFPHYLPSEYAQIADNLRKSIELPASIDDNCFGRPWFHAESWWPCMDTSVLDREEWFTVIAYSHAHIMMVDEAIGIVLDTLERLGLEDSTTVIFTADHGDMEGAHNRFDKGPYFYDEVWRIPLIIRQPGHVACTQSAFVSILDVGETLFNLIDNGNIDSLTRLGRSLLPLIGNPEHGGDWPDLCFGVYDLYNGISFVVRAIRNRRWKYVWNPQEFDELYDLEKDPYETVNLIDEPAATKILSLLRKQLHTWLREIDDDLPERMADLPPAGIILKTGKMGP
jgi:arylsulfatase A-like enzyme